jgi:antitoxin component of MazEF toxin-antitoxin module
MRRRRPKKAKARKRYTCAELMADFKPEYRHPEWNVGPPVGKEIW